MRPTLDQVSCASLPAHQLAALGVLRGQPCIRVLVRAGRAWVYWPAGRDEVLRKVFPISDVALYARCQDLWYQPGHHLPSFEVPDDLEPESVPLSSVLVPAPTEIAAPVRSRPEPARLGLVRDELSRPATALRCRLIDLSAWAETVPSTRFEPLRAAIAGEVVMVLGRPLPAMAGEERYWGKHVLIPLGFRAEPALPDDAIRRALGVAGEAVLVLAPRGFEVIPGSVFRPLTRAGIRLAERGRSG